MNSTFKLLATTLFIVAIITGCSLGNQVKFGLSVAVETEQGPSGQTIGPDYFQGRQGDRFRLLFKSDQEGFLYAINQGSSGVFSLLFPNRDANLPNNLVKAGETFKVPPDGADSWLRFDETPGAESITVFLSKNRIDVLEKLFNEGAADSARVQSALAQLAKDTKPGGSLTTNPSQNETKFLFSTPDASALMKASIMIYHQ